jgi:hypothetical protein
MNFTVLDTEDIARQMKRADLPPKRLVHE